MVKSVQPRTNDEELVDHINENLDKAILHECHLKLCAENKRLTVKGLSLEYSMPRRTAAEVLEALPYFDVSAERTYQVTRLMLEKKESKHGKFLTSQKVNEIVLNCNLNNTEVAKLQTFVETIYEGSEQQDSSSPIHSIALMTTGGTSSILSDHIQTISLLHDYEESLLDPTILCDMIEPAVEIQKADEEQLREQRVKRSNLAKNGMNVTNIAKESTSRDKKPSAVSSQKKPTSAASFFGSSTRSVVPAPNKSSSTKDIEGDKKISKEMNKSPTNTRTTTADKKISNPTNSKKAAKNNSSSTTTGQKRGNADDFVGDIDEDDEFLKEDQERMNRNKVRMVDSSKARMNQADELKSNDDDREVQNEQQQLTGNDDDSTKKSHGEIDKFHGAMDNFALKRKIDDKSDNSQQGKGKRVQSLEEKTFVDENGFFRTEMVTVWKTIDESDEGKDERRSENEEKLSSLKAKKTSSDSTKIKSKNPRGMKQQGLMGYFSKR